jgi:hypothetical protein
VGVVNLPGVRAACAALHLCLLTVSLLPLPPLHRCSTGWWLCGLVAVLEYVRRCFSTLGAWRGRRAPPFAWRFARMLLLLCSIACYAHWFASAVPTEFCGGMLWHT